MMKKRNNVIALAEKAHLAGIYGLICSPQESLLVKEYGLTLVTLGVREGNYIKMEYTKIIID